MDHGLRHSGYGCLWAESQETEGKWLLGEFIRINLGAANAI